MLNQKLHLKGWKREFVWKEFGFSDLVNRLTQTAAASSSRRVADFIWLFSGGVFPAWLAYDTKTVQKQQDKMTGHFRNENRTEHIKTCIKCSKKHPIYKIILKNPGLFYVGCETASPIMKFGWRIRFSIRLLNIARCVAV